MKCQRVTFNAVLTSMLAMPATGLLVAAEAAPDAPSARPASGVVAAAAAAQDVRTSLEAVRLRALQRFDLSKAGRLLADQTALLESRLAEAITSGSELERVELAALLQSARAALDAARERAVQRDPEVQAVEARLVQKGQAATRTGG